VRCGWEAAARELVDRNRGATARVLASIEQIVDSLRSRLEICIRIAMALMAASSAVLDAARTRCGVTRAASSEPESCRDSHQRRNLHVGWHGQNANGAVDAERRSRKSGHFIARLARRSATSHRSARRAMESPSRRGVLAITAPFAFCPCRRP